MANRDKMIDTLLQLKDAGLVASDAAATVSSSAKIIDTGGGYTEGKILIDVTALEVASGDECYEIRLQGSSSATFASGYVTLCALPLGADGDTAILNGSDADNTIGRFIMLFSNLHDSTVYRYLRLYTAVSGTIATGINYVAYITK